MLHSLCVHATVEKQYERMNALRSTMHTERLCFSFSFAKTVLFHSVAALNESTQSKPFSRRLPFLVFLLCSRPLYPFLAFLNHTKVVCRGDATSVSQVS